jgi:hypothetical protein
MKLHHYLLPVLLIHSAIPNVCFPQPLPDSTIISLMREYSDKLTKFEIMDSSSVNNDYSAIVVVGQADRVGDEEGWDELKLLEVFGIFILDNNNQLAFTIDRFYTKRLFDYTVRIQEISEDHLIIFGEGRTYGDCAWRMKYLIDLDQKTVLNATQLE